MWNSVSVNVREYRPYIYGPLSPLTSQLCVYVLKGTAWPFWRAAWWGSWTWKPEWGSPSHLNRVRESRLSRTCSEEIEDVCMSEKGGSRCTCEIYLGIRVLHRLLLDLQVGMECSPMKRSLMGWAGWVLTEEQCIEGCSLCGFEKTLYCLLES